VTIRIPLIILAQAGPRRGPRTTLDVQTKDSNDWSPMRAVLANAGITSCKLRDMK